MTARQRLGRELPAQKGCPTENQNLHSHSQAAPTDKTHLLCGQQNKTTLRVGVMAPLRTSGQPRFVACCQRGVIGGPYPLLRGPGRRTVGGSRQRNKGEK